MSKSDIYTVLCIVLGEDVPFSVEIEKNKIVSQLKDLIKEKRTDVFADIGSNLLDLYHVDILDAPKDDLMASMTAHPLHSRAPLLATTRLTNIFPGTPKDGTIHFIVKPNKTSENRTTLRNDRKRMREDKVTYCLQILTIRKNTYEKEGRVIVGPILSLPIVSALPEEPSDWLSFMSPATWCQRKDTVDGLLELLHKYHLVQVRGTPASGKTTLMQLLHARIVKERPEAQVFIHNAWPKPIVRRRESERLADDLPGYPSFKNGERYFLFDDGETTYWDTTLWTVFKDNIQSSDKPVYAILFCSYGRDARFDPYGPVPLVFGYGKVILDRTDRGLSKKCGLLLDEEEFRDVVSRRQLRLADDLRDFVYRFTRGHVGATVAVAEFLLKKRKSSMLSGVAYRLEDFHQDTPSYDEFCKYLSRDHEIGRGTRDPPLYAQAMRALLFHGSIHSYGEGVDNDIRLRLKEGYKSGVVNIDEARLYTFASPLHQQLWSWLLLPQTDHQLPFQDLLSFVKATVSQFGLSQLDGSDRRVGSVSHRPPEAQYQEEYYRCVHTLTQGNVRISPEYAAAAGSRPGRIDFFIPSKKWGIELTREGSKLDEHNSRFADDGAYKQWLQSSNMNDYVLLDFRSTKPMRAYPGINNLYSVVFSDEEPQLEIYDNKLNLRDSQNRVQQH